MSGSLQDSQAAIIQQLLLDLGLGTLVDNELPWPVYANHHPDSPDNSICVYSTEGQVQNRVQIDGGVNEAHGIQIRLRSVGPVDSYVKARSLLVALDTQVSNITVNVGDNHYVVNSIDRTSDVISLGMEAPTSERFLQTMNMLVTLTQTS